MPKEYVYGPAWDVAEQGIEGENVPFQMTAAVGWSRETDGGGVQLATIRNGAQGLFDPKDGLYMGLDRRGINSLIQLLRRARDQAFGRDE